MRRGSDTGGGATIMKRFPGKAPYFGICFQTATSLSSHEVIRLGHLFWLDFFKPLASDLETQGMQERYESPARFVR